ncbi:MAG: DUF5685 family protein [Planctomycetaceae bacterium]
MTDSGIDTMFGFLAPQRRIPKWRQAYARICQFQRQLYGLTSLPFMSYEAAFLYRLAIDFKLLPELPQAAAQCCRLRRLRNAEGAPDFQAASFAATFGVVLAGIKLQDDVQDSGRWFNRLLLAKFQRPIRDAHRFIARWTPGLEVEIASSLKLHSEMESSISGRKVTVSLAEYSEPTAYGFGAVFEAFAELLRPADREMTARFRDIGECVGRAIISWDCAVDFEHDRIKGQFNLLKSEADVLSAFEFALLQLSQIGWQIPDDSTDTDVLIQVADRIRCRRKQPVSSQPLRRLERWGLIREKRFAYAKCDGCEGLCLVGECCECTGGAGEAASCCAASETGSGLCALGEGTPCCCDAMCFCPDCVGCTPNGQKKPVSESAATTSGTADVYSKFEAQHGVAASSLNPSGFVTIDGERVPGRSQTGEFIQAGARVTVTSTNPFGVFVRKQTESG